MSYCQIHSIYDCLHVWWSCEWIITTCQLNKNNIFSSPEIHVRSLSQSPFEANRKLSKVHDESLSIENYTIDYRKLDTSNRSIHSPLLQKARETSQTFQWHFSKYLAIILSFRLQTWHSFMYTILILVGYSIIQLKQTEFKCGWFHSSRKINRI